MQPSLSECFRLFESLVYHDTDLLVVSVVEISELHGTAGSMLCILETSPVILHNRAACHISSQSTGADSKHRAFHTAICLPMWSTPVGRYKVCLII